jgi:hypothetical protein
VNIDDPEPLLLEFLELYGDLVPPQSLAYVREYVEHGECGIAYDLLVFHIQHQDLVLPKRGEDLIRLIAARLGVSYPTLSTG